MTIVQTNSLPLPLETFTQPCAEQRKSLVEQTEEITVELLLESNDIQLFGNKLRFLVAPQNERELQQCNSFLVILENFRLCLIQRTLEELPDFEVMTWQLCRMLRSALNCFQVTRFCVQK
jgi:hypothetical protein